MKFFKMFEKNLNDGGAIITDNLNFHGLVFKDERLYKKLNLLKNFGIASPEEVVLSGTNAKLNEIQAAVGLEVLNIVEEERAKRKAIKNTYIEG